MFLFRIYTPPRIPKPLLHFPPLAVDERPKNFGGHEPIGAHVEHICLVGSLLKMVLRKLKGIGFTFTSEAASGCEMAQRFGKK